MLGTLWTFTNISVATIISEQKARKTKTELLSEATNPKKATSKKVIDAWYAWHGESRYNKRGMRRSHKANHQQACPQNPKGFFYWFYKKPIMLGNKPLITEDGRKRMSAAHQRPQRAAMRCLEWKTTNNAIPSIMTSPKTVNRAEVPKKVKRNLIVSVMQPIKEHMQPCAYESTNFHAKICRNSYDYFDDKSTTTQQFECYLRGYRQFTSETSMILCHKVHFPIFRYMVISSEQKAWYEITRHKILRVICTQAAYS